VTIRFGTDGWRGVISRDFTFDSLRRVVAAVGEYLSRVGSTTAGVAVGYDRRFLSEHYAREAAGVLAARGVPVYLAREAVPTPLVSWAVRAQQLAGGLVITASHNPPEWNGLKFKESFGGAARTRVSREIEEILAAGVPPGEEVPCLSLEEAARRDLLLPLLAWDGYREALRRLVDFEALGRARLSVAVDCMHGAGTPWLRLLLEEAGCRVHELHGEANPGFRGIPPEPKEECLAELMAAVASGEAVLGLATDGDADRIAAVDERGRYFSPQRILAVLLKYLWEEKGHRGDAVRAVNGTTVLDLLAEGYGAEVVQTPIGFKYMGEVMLERQVVLAGEESGGIGVGAHLPERDGMLNALLLAEIVAATGKGLRAYLQEVFDRVGHFSYERLDFPLSPEESEAARAAAFDLAPPNRLAGLPVHEVDRTDGVKIVREDRSWVLIRPSGTEPLLRVYAEARTLREVHELLHEGRRLAGFA
jgi:phosphomannomutase